MHESIEEIYYKLKEMARTLNGAKLTGTRIGKFYEEIPEIDGQRKKEVSLQTTNVNMKLI